MPRQKKINNELINQKNSENGNLETQRKRGRPKGSKNSIKITRQDKQPTTEQGENKKYLLHDIKLSSLPAIDINDNPQVEQRINDYFLLCADDDIKPSVASLALAFGFSRFTLFDFIAGRNKTITNKECILTLKKAYDRINSYYEHMMNNGKINPVAGIFLMKNNMGYKDTTDHIITANNNTDPTTEDITSKAGLLD